MSEIIGYLILALIILPFIIWAENDFIDEHDRKRKD